MQHVSTKHGKEIVLALIRAIQQNKDFLSEVDGAIGDGDHGINMNKGFSMCEARLDDSCEDLALAFRCLADVLLTEIGGSMGPIYGTFFKRMARQCAKKEAVDAAVFEGMLISAAEGIMEIGGAQPGDKSCLDCIVPAAEAFKQANAGGASFSDAIKSMMAAAESGKDATKEMLAKIGRSSRLGERSRGTLDAGAVSSNIILQTIGAQFLQLMAD